MAGNGDRWRLTKEKILLWAGLLLIFSQIPIEILNPSGLGAYVFEFLFTGLALCGISISRWGDKL